jgi:predicted house-cleaning noncanonical NTP pyrophosphatase (MazG superfamily)
VIYDNPSWEKPTSIPDPVEVQYQDSNGRAVGFHEIEFNPLFNWVDLQYSWDKKPILESFIKYCMLVLNVVPAIYLGNLSKPSFFGMLDMAISCIQEKEEYILENVKEWSAPQKTLQSTIGHGKSSHSITECLRLIILPSATTFQAKEPVDMEDYQQWKNNKLEENLKAIEGRVEDLQGRLNDALQASETLKENLKAAEEYNNNLQDKLDVERGNFQSLKDKHEKLAGRILGVVNEASE